MDIDLLLKRIEERPELFIGGRDIRALRHFLAGYIMAMEEWDPGYHDDLFSGFTAYLARKYDDKRSLDWASLIAAHEVDGGATDAFFRLWSEYRTRSNGS